MVQFYIAYAGCVTEGSEPADNKGSMPPYGSILAQTATNNSCTKCEPATSLKKHKKCKMSPHGDILHSYIRDLVQGRIRKMLPHGNILHQCRIRVNDAKHLMQELRFERVLKEQ